SARLSLRGLQPCRHPHSVYDRGLAWAHRQLEILIRNPKRVAALQWYLRRLLPERGEPNPAESKRDGLTNDAERRHFDVPAGRCIFPDIPHNRADAPGLTDVRE